jgi:putative transposase
MRDGRLTLAKIAAPLEFVWSFDEVDVTTLDPTMVVVAREPDGRWYVTFQVDTADSVSMAQVGHAIGVDLGVRDFLVTSDGNRLANPRHLERGKVRNARQDFLHRTSTNLVRSADLIAIEDLAIKNMVRNRRLARVISDAGWGEFRRQLEYKATRAGRTLVVINRWYPSSKTCSACGYQIEDLKLSVRHRTCPDCRTRHDRDLNAARNILAAGRAVARSVSGDACGADVRRQGHSLPRSAWKQETRTVRCSA